MIDNMTETAQEGLDFRFDLAPPGNTFDAHRLLQGGGLCCTALRPSNAPPGIAVAFAAHMGQNRAQAATQVRAAMPSTRGRGLLWDRVRR